MDSPEAVSDQTESDTKMKGTFQIVPQALVILPWPVLLYFTIRMIFY